MNRRPVPVARARFSWVKPNPVRVRLTIRPISSDEYIAVGPSTQRYRTGILELRVNHLPHIFPLRNILPKIIEKSPDSSRAGISRPRQSGPEAAYARTVIPASAYNSATT